MILDYIALAILVFVILVFVYGLIAIHDIPYEIAKSRNHPHQDAIMAAGWVSLFTLHAIWPFLWIWAMAYRPDRGWGTDHAKLEARVADLEKQLVARRSSVE
ncbi:DUF3302 domain-containing protein [Rhizobium sp. ZPR3]|uniref:DUF3302 domain-containing protein n=2 Tax=unclassified Rhizobium TaxID=2613769 RepID=A0AAU7SPF6_9HYPH